MKDITLLAWKIWSKLSQINVCDFDLMSVFISKHDFLVLFIIMLVLQAFLGTTSNKMLIYVKLDENDLNFQMYCRWNEKNIFVTYVTLTSTHLLRVN